MLIRCFLLSIVSLVLIKPLLASDCALTVNSTDQMSFSTREIIVDSSCSFFNIKLKHIGSLPKYIMGHNWVLSSKEDMPGVVSDGISAGLSNNYVKEGDTRVIIHTKIIGGSEEDSVTLDTKRIKIHKDYIFFCTFPGHSSMMRGLLRLV